MAVSRSCCDLDERNKTIPVLVSHLRLQHKRIPDCCVVQTFGGRMVSAVIQQMLSAQYCDGRFRCKQVG